MYIATTLCTGEEISFYGDIKIKCRKIVDCIIELFTPDWPHLRHGIIFLFVGFPFNLSFFLLGSSVLRHIGA